MSLLRTRARAPRGFTLIELLVAIAVFGTLAAMAYGGLNAVLRTRAILDVESERLKRLTLTVESLTRDLRQALARPVRSNYGELAPALVGSADRVELTRLGFANPLAEPRAQVERVLYTLDNQRLQRASYAVLDRAPGSVPVVRDLLGPVTALRFRYMDADQHWWDQWPPQRVGRQRVDELPRAAELVLTLEAVGEIRRLVELPGTPSESLEGAAPPSVGTAAAR